MKALWRCLAWSSLLIVGCTIERTPEEYIDHLVPPEAELRASEDELTTRLRATAEGLELRSPTEVLAALAPAEEVVGIGPSEGEVLTSPADVAAALDRLTREARQVRPESTLVTVGPNNTLAWFQTAFRLEGSPAGREVLRFSGVYRRQEGEWRLRQFHLSWPATEGPIPEAGADTQAGDG